MIRVGELLLTGHHDGSVSWWNTATGHLLKRKSHKNSVSCLCLSRARGGEVLVVTGSFDGSLGLWSEREHGHFAPYLVAKVPRAHEGREVTCVAFHQESGLIVSGGNDGLLRLWSHDQPRSLLRGHDDCVSACVTCPDSPLLVSASEDKVIIVWSVKAASPLHLLRVSFPVQALFGLAGNRLAVAASIVTLWDLSDVELSQAQDAAEGVAEVEAKHETRGEVIGEGVLGKSCTQARPDGRGPRKIRELTALDDDEPMSLGFLESPVDGPANSQNGFILIGSARGVISKVELPRC